MRRLGTGRHVALLAVAATLATSACGSRTATERHLVFVRGNTPADQTVWIADASGAHARKLAPGYAAVISPDGQSVAIGRDDGVHLVSADGKNDRRLTARTLEVPLAWAPDSGQILAAGSSFALVDVDSGRSRALGRSGSLYGFDFSLDGHRLIYSRAATSGDDICSARGDLYVVGVDGGKTRRLTHDGRSFFPRWGPGKQIAFARLPQQRRIPDCFTPGIWTVRTDGSTRRPIIARAPASVSRSGYYGLAPIAWLNRSELLVGIRSEWGDEAAVLDRSTKRLRRVAVHANPVYVDKISRDRQLVLGSAGNERVTISIARISDGRRLFVLRGDVCCPDWNR